MEWQLNIPKSGIYQIQSIIKIDKCYIGSSSNIDKRIREHKRVLNKNQHDNPKLQSHYNKYGPDDMVFCVIEECDIYDLIEREQYYLDTIKPWFNICGTAGNCMGRILSIETKQKISKGNRGKIMSEESKIKISNALKGRPSPTKGKKQSEETISKRVRKNTGLKRSFEIRKKMSESKKGKKNYAYGKPAHNRGSCHSEESKRKMRLAHKNISEETRLKMSISAKNRRRLPHSEITKQKISNSHLGKRLSLSTEFKKGHIYYGKRKHLEFDTNP